MISLQRVPLFLAGMIIFVSCSRPPPYENKKYDEQVDKSRTYRNIRIPLELRNILLAGSKDVKVESAKKDEHGSGHDSGHDSEKKAEHEAPAEESHGGEGSHGGEVKAPPPPPDAEFDRATLNVYLAEKSPALLKGRNTVLEYKSGGGELDLAEFISPKHRGTFYVAMKPAFDEDVPFEVYFLSNSKPRKVGDESLGSGCNSFYKVTSYFVKQMKAEGFAVNTTDERHVSALQGVYFFIFKRASGRVGLAYLDLKDSRFPELRCRL